MDFAGIFGPLKPAAITIDVLIIVIATINIIDPRIVWRGNRMADSQYRDLPWDINYHRTYARFHFYN